MIRSWLVVLAVAFGVLGDAAAQERSAGETSPLWNRGLERVHSLYLWRSELESTAMLDGVIEQLESDIPWLMVQDDGGLYRFSYGEQEAFQTLSVGEGDDLEQSLGAIAALLDETPAELPDGFDAEISIMRGLARALDRHSKLLHGEKLTSFDKRLSGTLSGIGSRMMIRENRLTIVEVYENAPAGRAGLMANDRVLRIDDVSTLGMSLGDAVDRITGPKGTEVSLLIEREEGAVSVQLEMTLVRDEVRIPNVTARSLAPGIGYARIDHFSERTVENLRRLLGKLEREEGIDRGLVIDLRGNTGGSMIQSARAADLFLNEGELVRTEGPDGRKVRGLVHRLLAQPEKRDYSMPLVVLQNQRTASGAEILAGALQESGRALLVGSNTFGKGSVQKVYTLRRDARFKLTVARYLVAGYREIADIGLRPDVPIGRLTLTQRGLDFSMEQAALSDGLDPLFYVERGEGWVPGLEGQQREDYALDLAAAILERTPSARLTDLVSAASELVSDLREEEEGMLVAQMALRGLDWGEAEEGAKQELTVEAQLRFASESVEAGELVELEVVAWNRSEEPVSQMVAELSSVDRVFDGVQIPLGWMDPGEEVRSRILLQLPAGRTGRDSHVELLLRDSEKRQVSAGVAVLSYEGSGVPEVALRLDFEPGEERSSVELELENLSSHRLEDLRVRLLHPESAGVELLEYDASVGTLRPGKTGRGSIALRVEPTAEVLPLRVLIEADDFGRLAQWDVELATDGTPVTLDAPHIEVQRLPSSVQAGPVRLNFNLEDDREIESVISYIGGEKFSYSEGGSPNLSLALDVLIDEGPNSVALRVRDNQGLERVRSWVIHGAPVSSTTDVDGSSDD